MSLPFWVIAWFKFWKIGIKIVRVRAAFETTSPTAIIKHAEIPSIYLAGIGTPIEKTFTETLITYSAPPTE